MSIFSKDKKLQLSIELVPSTSFYNNLRSTLPKSQWDILRRASYRGADYVCEICGGKGERHPVECHEIWEYNDKRHIQKLIGLISLCPKCHACKHIGLSQIRGLEEECIEHLMLINGINKHQAKNMILDAFEKWAKRSQHIWKIDLSWLKEKCPVCENKEGENEKN